MTPLVANHVGTNAGAFGYPAVGLLGPLGVGQAHPHGPFTLLQLEWAGMGLAIVFAGSIPYTIGAFVAIVVVIVGTIAYWRVRKPRYDGGRVIVMAYIAAVVTFIALALWMRMA